MKTHLFIKLCFYFSFILFASCSTEDDGESNDPTDNLITVNIAEYPSSGDLITEINSSLEGSLSYNITLQTVSQAILINGNELRVGDWLAFDFEANEFLYFNVEVSNGNDTELLEYKIAIQDVDDIWAFLNGNTRTTYEDASLGEWVWITESEYNALANYLANTTKSGASDTQLFNNNSVQQVSGGKTFANANQNSMPMNHYFFAFKYYSWSSNATSNRVKLSETSTKSSFTSVGEILPEHDDGFNHFVLKGVNTKTMSEAYLGLYASLKIGAKDDNSSSYNHGGGNTANLDDTVLGKVLLQQGLSTSLKQWD
ncbi:hypothetical protein [Psychroserpens ponticola]|uniref:Uncharacterized protein n=1 Tax=Psychroserpens ponticola TaxID=2932268 RepID=A0ABY7S286_9FLAO|nr:hypothetical protein [Psychroserpens ponticola]WCO03253.1 hypothetical protein MUN68_007075 [Psychroserpens ponticola]